MSTTVTTSQNSVDVSENNNTIIISPQAANQVTITSTETLVSVNEDNSIITVQTTDATNITNTEKQIVTVTEQNSNQVSITNTDTNAITVKSGIAGPQGERGISIISTTSNTDGTFSIVYSDGATFTSSDLTGPRGISGLTGFANSIAVQNISSSANISASGVIIGSNLSGTNTGDQNIANLAITGSNVTFAHVTGSNGKFENLTILTAGTPAILKIKETGATNSELDFATFGTDKFTIGGTNLLTLDIHDSYIGIGETVPTEKLHVNGNIKATGTIVGSNLSGTNTGDQDLSSYALKSAITGAFYEASHSFHTRVTANDNKTGYTDNLVKAKLNTENVISSSAQLPSGIVSSSTQLPSGIVSSSLQIFANITSSGDISGSGIGSFGSLGVGTDAPTEKLHIVGGDLKIQTNANAGVIHFGDTSDETKIVGYDSTLLPNDSRLDFFVAEDKKFTIRNSGNVGIGTDNPNEKLEVVGNISASKNIIANDITASNDINANRIRLSNAGSVNDVAISPHNDIDTGIYFPAPNAIYLKSATGNSEIQITDNQTVIDADKIILYGNVSASGDISSSATGSFEHGYINKNLIVGGIVVAQEIHTTFVSSSVTYATSSNQFGDSSDDKHEFTGSVEIRGLIKSNGLIIHSGSNLGDATTANLTEHPSNLYYTDARVKTKLNAENVITSSAQVKSNLPTNTISSSNQIKTDISGSWQGQNFISSSQIVMYVSGAYGDGTSQLSKTFATMSFDYGTGIHVSESSNRPGEALISLGSAFHTISASNGNAKATGSDTIIFEAGNNMTVQVTQPTPGDANSHHKMTFTSTSDPIPAGTISSSQQIFTAVTSSGDISGSGTGSFGFVTMGGKGFDLSGATKNDVLMFDGTNFVAVNLDDNPTFEFVVNSFTVTGHGGGTQLIGTGTWKAAGAITYEVSYKNGPATTCNVTTIGESNNVPVLAMTQLDGNSAGPDTNVTAIHYPASVGNSIFFRLNADDGVYSAQLTPVGSTTFKNYWVSGSIGNNTTKNATSIGTLVSGIGSPKPKTFNGNESFTLSIGASEYLAFAHRKNDLTNGVRQVRCGTGNNQLTVAMNPDNAESLIAKTTVSNYQNTANFQEDFYYYVSSGSNLSSHSSEFALSNSTTKKNYIFWGSEASWTANETNVKSLANKNSSHDGTTNTLTGTVLTTITLEGTFAIVAIPTRHLTSNYQLFDNINNQPIAFDTPDVVTITNPVGFQEDYNVFKSSNPLGSVGSPFDLQILIKGI